MHLAETLAVAASGLVTGAVHGLGPDHCAGLAALLVRDRAPGAAVRVSLRFGAGHAVVLGLIAGGVTLLGALIPARWEQVAEVAGGLTLVAIGALLLARRSPPRSGDADAPAGWAAPLLGGALALSGVRGLALSLPPLLLAGHSWRGAVAFLGSFGLGVTASMLGFGLLFSGTRRRLAPSLGVDREARLTTGLVGLASVALGALWVWRHLN